jgi:hypothetical protein
VGVAKINEKFQLHRIVTKFGVPGVLMKAIKSCKFQLDRDAALGVQGVSKNPIVHFIIQSDAWNQRYANFKRQMRGGRQSTKISRSPSLSVNREILAKSSQITNLNNAITSTVTHYLLNFYSKCKI